MSETKQSGFSDNTAGALAYITPLPAIAFLILVPYKKSLFVRFHAWQSILLTFFAIVISCLLTVVLGWLGISGKVLMLPATWLIAILWLILWAFCAINALSGKSAKLPIIGAYAEKQANG
ncbi:MAG: hypothetical protein ABR991_02975 [Terracidiphilus sp.]|jgi:uncharacterized membrane protein